MADAKHTPGPWVNHGCYIYRVGTDGKRTGPAIANTRVDEFITPEEEEQNARLIAAAPELYEALRTMVDAFPFTDESAGQYDAVQVAREAIAKATPQP